jgi:hypothetical protein
MEEEMSWTDRLGNLLKQYTSSGAAAQPAPDVRAHFDQVTQAAPPSVIAEGLTAAFNSDKTPAFAEMLSTLFNNSNGEQKTGMVNQLLSSIEPTALTRLLPGVGLAGLVGADRPQMTTEQAQKLSQQAVEQLATHAQNSNPSIVESISGFYAQHPTLVKTLGGTALTVALAKIAERQGQA